MSVDCKGYIGYTITLKENLNHDDFDFFHEFEEKYPEYSDYQNDLKNKPILIIDGMNGLYARLCFIDEILEECWIEGEDYIKLRKPSIPRRIKDELNKIYQLMYDEKLDENQIDYALWFHFV